MIDPVVQIEGNIAVLTFNMVNYGEPSGRAEEAVLARVRVYREIQGGWRISREIGVEMGH
ncbi:MAG TPA: hypothetical protein VFM44_02295 [Gemmatimonadota bacterium]|nr:hypothetical protein [Gemmatimonadota bacterium]